MKGFDAQHWLGLHWPQLIVPICVLAFTLAIGYAAKRLMTRLLRPWAARATGHAAQIVIDALKGPFMIWVLILGMHLAMQSSELPYRATFMIGRILLVLWILSLTLISSRLAGDLIRFYGSDIPGALPVTTLTQTLAQLGVVILGVLVLLNLLGISVTPILTALGVGGLAVALALQDTLSNLFAGFYIAVARQVRLGDYIRLNTGEEGYVTDIGWRSTTVRCAGQHHDHHSEQQAGASHRHELLSAGKTRECVDSDRRGVRFRRGPGGAGAARRSPDRRARNPRHAGRSGARRELRSGLRRLVAELHAWDITSQEFADQFRVRHELRKRILKRLRQEKIDMPFPTRTIYVRGQGGSA